MTKPPRPSSSLYAENGGFCYREPGRDTKWPCHHEELSKEYSEDNVLFSQVISGHQIPSYEVVKNLVSKAHPVSLHHPSILTPSLEALKFPAAIAKNKYASMIGEQIEIVNINAASG